MSNWELSPGPERPLWEPVKLADFSGERGEALQALNARLNEIPLQAMDDETLALYAILLQLFTDTALRVDHAKARALTLATQALPDPGHGRRRRLSTSRRDDLLITVGRMWGVFTAPYFPLNRPHIMQGLGVATEE